MWKLTWRALSIWHHLEVAWRSAAAAEKETMRVMEIIGRRCAMANLKRTQAKCWRWFWYAKRSAWGRKSADYFRFKFTLRSAFEGWKARAWNERGARAVRNHKQRYAARMEVFADNRFARKQVQVTAAALQWWRRWAEGTAQEEDAASSHAERLEVFAERRFALRWRRAAAAAGPYCRSLGSTGSCFVLSVKPLAVIPPRCWQLS